MDFLPDSAIICTASAILCIIWLLWQWSRQRGQLARLGGLLDVGAGFLLAGSLLGALFSPWQSIALEGSVCLWGALALGYAIVQASRQAKAETLLIAGRAICTLFFILGLWALYRGNGTLSVWALGALCWVMPLCAADKGYWKGIWIAVCLCALAGFGSCGKLYILPGGVIFALGSLYVARRRGWLSVKQLGAIAFALCAGVWAVLAVFQTLPSQERMGENPFLEKNIPSCLRGEFLLGGERPLSGWGLNCSSVAYPKVAAQTFWAPTEISQVDNTPLHVLAETGALGLIGALFLIIGLLRRWRAVLREKDSPVNQGGSFVCTTGAALFVLSMAGLPIVGHPIAANALWFGYATAIGLFAAAASVPEKNACFNRKTRLAGIALCIGLLFVGLYTLWNQVLFFCAPLKTEVAGLQDFRLANRLGESLSISAPDTPEKAVQAFSRSLQLNPYQPQLWQKLAQIGAKLGDWRGVDTAAGRGYRLAPNLEGMLPLQAVAAGHLGHTEQIPLLLSLETLNEPSFLLKDPGMQTLEVSQVVCELTDALYTQLEKDLPVYAGDIAYARALLQWINKGSAIAPESVPLYARPFWKALSALRAGHLPNLPEGKGWGCLLRLWDHPEKASEILDKWYAEHPELSYPKQKRTLLLRHLSKRQKLQDLLRPIEGCENPLWTDLSLGEIFLPRGFLPPAVRLPLYEGLIENDR